MEKTCESCGKQFRRKDRSRANRFCSVACYTASGVKKGPRKEHVKGRRQLYLPNHPLAKKTGIIAEHRVVLYGKIGVGPHTCHWCGDSLDWLLPKTKGMIITDHLDHDSSNNAPENLVPACNNCNVHRTKKGTRSLIQPGELFVVLSNGSRTRAEERTCILCGSTFLDPPSWKLKRCQSCRV